MYCLLLDHWLAMALTRGSLEQAYAAAFVSCNFLYVVTFGLDGSTHIYTNACSPMHADVHLIVDSR